MDKVKDGAVRSGAGGFVVIIIVAVVIATIVAARVAAAASLMHARYLFWETWRHTAQLCARLSTAPVTRHGQAR